jgi:hypothetical protein
VSTKSRAEPTQTLASRATPVDVSNEAPQAHRIVNAALHRSILQVSYLYFSKGGRISIMSKTNTGSNSNEYY